MNNDARMFGELQVPPFTTTQAEILVLVLGTESDTVWCSGSKLKQYHCGASEYSANSARE